MIRKSHLIYDLLWWKDLFGDSRRLAMLLRQEHVTITEHGAV